MSHGLVKHIVGLIRGWLMQLIMPLVGFFEKRTPGWEAFNALEKRRRLRRYRRVAGFLLVALMLLVSAALIFWCAPLGRVCYGVMILTLGMYLVMVFRRTLQSNFWRYILFFLILINGIIVYELKDGDVLSARVGQIIVAVNSNNNALAAFFPSRGDYEIKSIESSWVAGVYVFLHAATYIFIAMLAVSLWGRKLINSWRNFIVPEQQKYVFWGQNLDEKMLLLARDIYCQTVDGQILTVISRQCAEAGSDEDCLYGLAEQNDFILELADCGRPMDRHGQAPYHFFVSDDQHWNVQMAQKLLEQISGEVPLGDKPKVFVRIGDGEICELFGQWADSAKQFVDIHLVNEFALMAQKFTREYPMLDCPGISVDLTTATVNGEFNLLLLGFGWLGRELLRDSVADAQFVGTKFYADIIDFDCGHFEIFGKRCADAVREYDLKFHSCNVLHECFFDFVRTNLSRYNRVIVCLGNDQLNIEISELLLKLAKTWGIDLENKLFTHIAESQVYDYCRVSSPGFIAFGLLRDIYQKEMIVDERQDRLAKILNAKWRGSDDLAQSWHAASIFDRDSSRASAMGQFNLLRLLGLAAVRQPGDAAVICDGEITSLALLDPGLSPADRQARSSVILDNLARAEHLRWNAYHFMLGIQHWNPGAPPDFYPEVWKANQIRFRNAHAALVPYDQLPQIDCALELHKVPGDLKTPADFIGMGLQGHDIAFAKSTIQNMRQLGYAVVPRRRWPQLKRFANQYFAVDDERRYLLYYHNFMHFEQVASAAGTLAKKAGLSESWRSCLIAAGYFHDLGYLENSAGHEAVSARIAGESLGGFGFSPHEVKCVQALIMETVYPYEPKTLAGKLLCDADMSHLGRPDFVEWSDKLRAENIALGMAARQNELQNITDDLAFLEKTVFFTPEAELLWGAGRKSNIEKLRKKTVDLKDKA